MQERETYSQRDWDRTVGYGEVPEEYREKPDTEEVEDSEEDSGE